MPSQYYEPKVRSGVFLMLVAFWTGVPLLAVALAVSWPPFDLGWLGGALWLVVMVSSAFLTAQTPRALALRFSEWLVYPATLCVAFYLLLLEFIFV